jgi:predicted proteasome-type protease
VGIYRADSYKMEQHLNLDMSSAFYSGIQKQWSEGIRTAFGMLPRFDWELQ